MAFAEQEAAALGAVEASQPSAAAATTLSHFLANHVSAAAKPVNIWVVGHSKSGALAPALALWLADSRDAGGADNWDPGKRALLHLATFAAPTAGNGGFAARVQATMATIYRLMNPYDLVPHVWDPAEVEQIPGLYGLQLMPLKPLQWLLVPWLRRQGYQHECPAEDWPRGSGSGKFAQTYRRQSSGCLSAEAWHIQRSIEYGRRL